MIRISRSVAVARPVVVHMYHTSTESPNCITAHHSPPSPELTEKTQISFYLLPTRIRCHWSIIPMDRVVLYRSYCHLTTTHNYYWYHFIDSRERNRSKPK